jgi:hypothetical protein
MYWYAAIAWIIWKRRNAIVFNNIDEPLPVVLLDHLSLLLLVVMRYFVNLLDCFIKVQAG